MAEKTDLQAGNVFDTGERDQAMLVLKREADGVRVAELGGEQRNGHVIAPSESVRVWNFAHPRLERLEPELVTKIVELLRTELANLAYAEDAGLTTRLRIGMSRPLEAFAKNAACQLFEETQFYFGSERRDVTVTMSTLNLAQLPFARDSRVNFREFDLTQEHADWLDRRLYDAGVSGSVQRHIDQPIERLHEHFVPRLRRSNGSGFSDLQEAHRAAQEALSRLATDTEV